MRKLKLQLQLTIDGFMAGESGEMDWMQWNWDADLIRFVGELTTPVDCVVLGRKLAEGFIPHWAGVAADPKNPENSAGLKFTETPKVVFSKSMNTADPAVAAWKNTAICDGDLAAEITRLKSLSGGDIIAYGGIQFISSLIETGLVDEFNFFINPSIIGKGQSPFHSLPQNVNLDCKSSKAFRCGIVVNTYVPAKPNV